MHTSIVILNWNGKNWLEQFLPSVIRHSAGAEVIVADNNSTDGSMEWLGQAFPTVRQIRLTTNHGFAGGTTKRSHR